MRRLWFCAISAGRTLSLVFLTPAMLTACAGFNPPREFHEAALVLQASQADKTAFNLPFDAYVIGIEKDKVSRIGAIEECADDPSGGDCIGIDAHYFRDRPELQARVRKLYTPQLFSLISRPTWISHIVRYSAEAPACFIVNGYDMSSACAGVTFAGMDSTVKSSWQALRSLGTDLNVTISTKRPTHVIVYVMGWNTAQREAFGNFRELVGHLNVAAKERPSGTAFRPLIIGVTWASTGMPKVPKTDFLIKAKDADEVGAVWINALIHRELRKLKARHDFKLIVVGHSFGARATSRAVFSSPLMTASTEPIVDVLIGLQGAYSYQRYLLDEDSGSPEGREEGPYRDFSNAVTGITALTTSKHDTAVTSAGHERYFVGSAEVYSRTQLGGATSRFAHTKASKGGMLEALHCDPTKVLMIEASDVIDKPQPNTGGGAHSGIYTEQIGRLTYQLIEACAH